MNRGVEVGDGDGVLDDLLAEFVGDAVRSLMFQAAASEQQAEAGTLMSATASPVIGSRPAELRADGDECLVEDALSLEVRDQSGQGDVEFLDEQVLVLLAFVVSIPAGAVDEVEIV